MSVFTTTRELSGLHTYLSNLPQTDPLSFQWERNDVSHSPQRTVRTLAEAVNTASPHHAPVPRLGLWTDATLSINITCSSAATTTTWGALGAISTIRLKCDDQVLATLTPASILDWVTSLEHGAYHLWTGRQHLGNGPLPGELTAGVHELMIPIPLSILRRRHYVYTPWLRPVYLEITFNPASSWATNTSYNTFTVLYDFHELSQDVIAQRTQTAQFSPASLPTLEYDAYTETALTTSTFTDIIIPLTCRHNVFRIVLTLTTSNLSTVEVATLQRVRLISGDLNLYDATGAKVLKDMVTPPYHHNSYEKSSTYALQFSVDPQHTPTSPAGQTGFLSLAPMAYPHLILDLTTAEASLTITTTLLYYKTQSVSHTTGSILQATLA